MSEAVGSDADADAEIESQYSGYEACAASDAASPCIARSSCSSLLPSLDPASVSVALVLLRSPSPPAADVDQSEATGRDTLDSGTEGIEGCECRGCELNVIEPDTIEPDAKKSDPDHNSSDVEHDRAASAVGVVANDVDDDEDDDDDEDEDDEDDEDDEEAIDEEPKS